MNRRIHLFWGIPVFLGLFLFLVVLAPFFLVRVAGIRHWVLDRAGLASVLAGRQRVRVDQVTRLDSEGMTLVGLQLQVESPQGWQTYLRLGRLTASWRPIDLLSGTIHLADLSLDGAWVDLNLMPRPWLVARVGDPEKQQKGSLPPMACRRLRLARFQIIGPGERRTEGDVDLAELMHRGGWVQGEIRRVAVETWPDSIGVVLSRGGIRGRPGGALELDSLSLSSPGIEARLAGGWRKTSPDSGGVDRVRGHLTLGSFHPTGVNPIRRLGWPLRSDDSLQGDISFAGILGPGGAPNGKVTLDLNGRLMGQRLDTLLVQAVGSPDSASLRGLRLCSGSLRLDGEGWWIRPGARAAAHLHFAGLDLSGEPIALLARGLPRTLLGGEVSAEAEEIGPRLRLVADLRCDPGLIADRPVGGLSARARLDPKEIRVLDLRTTEQEPPALAATAVLDRGSRSLEVRGTLQALSLETWVEPWLGGLTLRGDASGSFATDGTLDRLRVSGDLDVHRGRVAAVFFDSLHVGRFAGSLSPVRLDGSLFASGCDLYKIPMDSIRGTVRLGDTISSALSAWHDTTSIFLRTRVVPQASGTVFLDSIRITPGSAPVVELAGASRLDWTPDLVHIDSMVVRSEAGVLGGRGWIRPGIGLAGREPFGFRLRGNDLRLGMVADFLGLSSQEIDGMAEVNVSGSGSMDAPDFKIKARLNGVRTYGWIWSRFDLSAGLGSQVAPAGSIAATEAPRHVALRIDSLSATSSGYIGARGGTDRVGPEVPGPPILLRADSLSLTTDRGWRESLGMLSDSVWELLERAEIGGTIRLQDLTITPILSPLLDRQVRQGSAMSFAPPLDPMLAVIRVERPPSEEEIARKTRGIGGLVSMTARIRGTGASPLVSIDLTGRKVHVYQAAADSVRFRGSYEDSLLTVKAMDWYMGDKVAHTQGEVPLSLCLGPHPLRLIPRPWRLATDLPETDLALATLFTSLIQDPSGRLSGHMELAGSPPALYSVGDLTVEDAAFRLPSREERLSHINARLHLDSTGVHILEATGRWAETGKVTASGSYRDARHFDLRGSARNAPVFESGNYRFVVDADVEARPSEGDASRPRVTGSAQVQEGIITIDLSKPPPIGYLPPYTPWLIDLRVVAPGNIRVVQPMATADLGEGELHVSFRWPLWSLGGSVNILDGRYRIFNRSFTVTEGTVTFLDTGTGPRPELSAKAETYIAGTTEGERVHVVLTVSGPAEALTVSMTGSSRDTGSPGGRDYSETELLELMSVGQLSGGQFASFTSGDPTRQYVSSELASQIERQLIENVPYADRFNIVWEPGSGAPARINYQPFVQPQWSLNYAQDLSAQPAREVSLRYRLSNLFFLNAAVDRKREETGTTDSYTLDVKYRIEY